MKAKTKTTRKRVYPILQQIVQYLPEWTLEKLANKHQDRREVSGHVISDEIIVLTGSPTSVARGRVADS